MTAADAGCPGAAGGRRRRARASWPTLGLPGIVDVARALPARAHAAQGVGLLRRGRPRHYGTAWPVHYRTPGAGAGGHAATSSGVRDLRAAGLPAQAGHGPLAHRVGHRVRRRHPRRGARPPRSSPSPTSPTTSVRRSTAGPGVVKVHVQVGGFDPRDPLLRPAWGLLADAGRAGGRALRQRPDPRRAHRAGRVRRGARRAPAAAGGAGARRACPTSAAPSDLRRPLRAASAWTRRWSAPRSASGSRRCPADWPARLVARRRPGRVRLRLPEHPVRLRRAAAVRSPAGPPPTTGSAHGFCVRCCTTRPPDCSSSDHCRRLRRRYSRSTWTPGSSSPSSLPSRRRRSWRCWCAGAADPGARRRRLSGRPSSPMRHRPMRHRPMRHRRRPPPSGSRPYRGLRQKPVPTARSRLPPSRGAAVRAGS